MQTHPSLQTRLKLAHDRAATSLPAIEKLLLDLLSHETDSLEGCVQASAVIAAAMAEVDFDLELHGTEQDACGQPPITIGWVGPRTSTPRILLCAHVDTSPVGERWLHNPHGEKEQEYIYGRGACVSKSDIAVFIHALKAARDAMEDMPHASAAVAITCDEGSGGTQGAAYLVNMLRIKPDVAIFAGFTDAITVAHNGCIQLKLNLIGTSCHQSLVPERGDTLRHATDICADLYKYADELSSSGSSIPGLRHPTLNVTKIFGGSSFGMAPATAEIWIDRRVLPDEDMKVAQEDLIRRISSTYQRSDVKVEIEVIRAAKPMVPSEATSFISSVLRREASRAFGRELPIQGTALYTDARWFSNAGVPTVMYGAGEANIAISGANGIDERVPRGFLCEATVVLARALTRLLSTSEPDDDDS